MFDRVKFKTACADRGMTIERVAHELGINQSTLQRKMGGVSDFTRSEIQNLIRLLELNDADVKSIFFADKLA